MKFSAIVFNKKEIRWPNSSELITFLKRSIWWTRNIFQFVIIIATITLNSFRLWTQLLYHSITNPAVAYMQIHLLLLWIYDHMDGDVTLLMWIVTVSTIEHWTFEHLMWNRLSSVLSRDEIIKINGIFIASLSKSHLFQLSRPFKIFHLFSILQINNVCIVFCILYHL